jgi:hypothetical protein
VCGIAKGRIELGPALGGGGGRWVDGLHAPAAAVHESGWSSYTDNVRKSGELSTGSPFAFVATTLVKALRCCLHVFNLVGDRRRNVVEALARLLEPRDAIAEAWLLDTWHRVGK